MTRYRLVTTGVKYVIPDTTVEAATDPSNDLAVALLHQELADAAGQTTTKTRIQHRSHIDGGWVDHEGPGGTR